MLYWGLAASAGVLSVIALIYDLEQTYFVALTVLAVPWLSRALSSGVRSALRAMVQTSGTIKLAVGQTHCVRLAVYNAGRMPRVLCRAQLALPEGLAPKDADQPQVDTLAPDSSQHLDVVFEAQQRGFYRIRSAQVLTTDVLGIFEYTVDLPDLDIEVVVWPRLFPVRRAPWLEKSWAGNLAYDAQQTDNGTSHGEVATDFFGIREYHPGDEIRRIHWPSTARHQSLTVIEYASVQRGIVTIVLDLEQGVHQGIGGPFTSFEWAVSFAATVAQLAIKNNMRVRLIAQGARDLSLAPGDGISDLTMVLDRLARVQADCPQPLERVVATRLHELAGGTVVVVTGRQDEQAGRIASMLRQAGCEARRITVDPRSFLMRSYEVPPNDGKGVFRLGEDPVLFLERVQ